MTTETQARLVLVGALAVCLAIGAAAGAWVARILCRG